MNLLTKKEGDILSFFFSSAQRPDLLYIISSLHLQLCFFPRYGDPPHRVPPAPTELLLRGFIIMHPRRHFSRQKCAKKSVYIQNPAPLEGIFRVLFEAHVGRKQGHPYPAHHHRTVDFKLPLGKWRCMYVCMYVFSYLPTMNCMTWGFLQRRAADLCSYLVELAAAGAKPGLKAKDGQKHTKLRKLNWWTALMSIFRLQSFKQKYILQKKKMKVVRG